MNVYRLRTVILLFTIFVFLVACAPTQPTSAPQSSSVSSSISASSSSFAPSSSAPSSTASIASSVAPPSASPIKSTPTNELRFASSGNTSMGNWEASIVVNPAKWTPGAPLQVQATLILSDAYLNVLASKNIKFDGFVMLVTAERTFDADGILRLPSDERMSTLLTPTGLAIEGGTQGAVSTHVGYGFRTPVDELVVVSTTAQQKIENLRQVTFNVSTRLPDNLPPGIYRLRLDYGASVKGRYYNLNAETFAKRGFPTGPCDSETFSPPILASAKHVSGKMIDASTIKPRIPWIILGNYNSNGYRGVVAEQDRANFALSNRNLIPDDVILPMYDENNVKNVLTYSLEPQFPTDTIYERNNIPWDYTKGELSIQITGPDGKTTDLGTAPFVGRQGQWPTTKNAKFTQWKPPMYGQYTVKATGWTQDVWGNQYTGGGTYKFWIAKRMTLATATFQGQAYPVGNRYGRDIGLAPAVPADIEVTATLFVNSDPKNPRTISYTGKASSGGMFTASQGLKPLNFDAPGEYFAQVLAKYTDPDGHLWVESMRHAGVIYPTDTPIVAHGKKVPVAGKLQDRGETNFEGYNTLASGGEQKLDHINFPYNNGDVLLIAAEYQGANKIEPVLSWDYKDKPMGYDPNIQGIGYTNVKIQTSNGYSPHLFPEYITDWMYYYGAGARPGFMGRFLIAEDGTRAPYWPTTNTNFGGQINASNNGDAPGDIYRLFGGVVIRKQNQAPLYAGYMSTAFIIPKGSNNNRVIAPGAEEIIGSTGEKSRIFLAMNARPGIVYETGMTFAPAFQIDPMVPVNMKFTLYYPDGRQVVASGVGDAGGSWAGTERWTLDVPGLYRYTVDSDWNGFKGLVPGMPKEGGQIYVVEKDRPSNAPGITFNLQPLTKIDSAKATKFTGSSTAKQIDYAMVIPGAVLAQGTIPVTNGKFEFTFDPAALNKIAQTYDVKNMSSGKAELADVVHLTFFSKETTPTTYHSFVRLVIRGNTVNYTK